MTRDFTKGARSSFYAMLFAMGCVFWVASASGNFTMSADVYGEEVLTLPSEIWAAAMMIPAGSYLIALYVNGRRRWTPYARLVCGLLTACYFSAFVVSAWPAAGGDLMVIASSVMMIKSGAFAYIDGVEMLRQRGEHE